MKMAGYILEILVEKKMTFYSSLVESKVREIMNVVVYMHFMFCLISASVMFLCVLMCEAYIECSLFLLTECVCESVECLLVCHIWSMRVQI